MLRYTVPNKSGGKGGQERGRKGGKKRDKESKRKCNFLINLKIWRQSNAELIGKVSKTNIEDECTQNLLEIYKACQKYYTKDADSNW